MYLTMNAAWQLFVEFAADFVIVRFGPAKAFDGALDGGLLLIVPSAALDGTLDGALDGGLLLITPWNRSRSP